MNDHCKSDELVHKSTSGDVSYRGLNSRWLQREALSKLVCHVPNATAKFNQTTGWLQGANCFPIPFEYGEMRSRFEEPREI